MRLCNKMYKQKEIPECLGFTYAVIYKINFAPGDYS